MIGNTTGTEITSMAMKSMKSGPWRLLEAVEFATLEWIAWFNHQRLLEPIGNMPPAERKALYYEQQSQAKKEA